MHNYLHMTVCTPACELHVLTHNHTGTQVRPWPCTHRHTRTQVMTLGEGHAVGAGWGLAGAGESPLTQSECSRATVHGH